MTPNPTSKVYAILPAPFVWIEIPAHKVTLENEPGFYGGGQTFDVAAYVIGKYPVTNAQFAVFIRAGGYENQAWWTDAGWQARETADWAAPAYWDDVKWNGKQQPVVGVSWYEASAYCEWLREASGEHIALPTEQQWQRAAQGDDRRAYPWGMVFDPARFRAGARLRKTAPVTESEGSTDSPYGVVGMVGEVWQWCLTAYHGGVVDLEGKGERIVRGCGWNTDAKGARVTQRDYRNPLFRGNYLGFRVCAGQRLVADVLPAG